MRFISSIAASAAAHADVDVQREGRLAAGELAHRPVHAPGSARRCETPVSCQTANGCVPRRRRAARASAARPSRAPRRSPSSAAAPPTDLCTPVRELERRLVRLRRHVRRAAPAQRVAARGRSPAPATSRRVEQHDLLLDPERVVGAAAPSAPTRWPRQGKLMPPCQPPRDARSRCEPRRQARRTAPPARGARRGTRRATARPSTKSRAGASIASITPSGDQPTAQQPARRAGRRPGGGRSSPRSRCAPIDARARAFRGPIRRWVTWLAAPAGDGRPCHR